MKRLTALLFIFYSIITLGQKREMAESFSIHNFDKAIAIGKEILKSEPEDFETNLTIARAEDEKGNFNAAKPFLEKSKTLMKEDWQKSWALLENAKNNFGLGNLEVAKQYYKDACKITGTKNSTKSLKSFGMLTGLDEFYNEWKIKETKNIVFHFQNGVNDEEIIRIMLTRQKAFDEINSFFKSQLPKKIDFFVWNMTNSFNPVLNRNLGFSTPVFSVSHNRLDQTPGHEIAHNISFWKSIAGRKTHFINEGIAVCFDQKKSDKLKAASEEYQKNPIDLKEIWKNDSKIDDEMLYPISGAFVEYLIKYDKEKFLELTVNQSYEDASVIYKGKIDVLISNFILKLKP